MKKRERQYKENSKVYAINWNKKRNMEGWLGVHKRFAFIY